MGTGYIDHRRGGCGVAICLGGARGLQLTSLGSLLVLRPATTLVRGHTIPEPTALGTVRLAGGVRGLGVPRQAAALIRSRAGSVHTGCLADGLAQGGDGAVALRLVAHVAEANVRGHAISVAAASLADRLADVLGAVLEAIAWIAGAGLRLSALAVNTA